MLIENKNKVTARIGKRSAPATGTVTIAAASLNRSLLRKVEEL